MPGFNGVRTDPLNETYPLGNGYRTYHPWLMRFHGPDSWSPFGAGGIHPYAYCAGDPVNRADPSGHHSLGGWLGIGMGVALGLLLTPVSGGSSLAVVLSVLSVVTGIASTGLAVAQQFVEASDPDTASALGWAALGTGIVSGLSSVALLKVVPGAQSLSALIKGTGQRPIGGLMMTEGEHTVRSRVAPVANLSKKVRLSNVDRMEHLTEEESCEIISSPSSLFYFPGSSVFRNEYTPRAWILYKNIRNPEALFYASDVIEYQYRRVSDINGFRGIMPEKIVYDNVMNADVLNTIKGKSGDALLRDFLDTTSLGKSTRRALQHYGMHVERASFVDNDLTLYLRDDPRQLKWFNLFW